MITAFQIILLILIPVGAFGAMGEKEDQNLRHNMTAICISAIIAFLVSVMYL